LTTAALWYPPRIITVMEPWDCFRLAPAELFRSLRAEIESGSIARGRLRVDVVEQERKVRWQRDGERAFPVSADEDFLLGIKMPAFWRYLDALPDTKFVVCVRDPVEVITSYGRAGRLAQGLDYDIAFHHRMNSMLEASIDDPLERRVRMFDYVANQVLPHLKRPNVHVVRYERWRTDATGQLAELGKFLGVEFPALPVNIEGNASDRQDTRIVRLVRAQCTTAEALGYHLGY
jgi:hypothetical protein